MKRRYVFTGVVLVLAIAIVAPVIAQTADKSAVSSKTKKAIKKEVAKQLKNKTGPAGPAGATGATGPQGPRGPSESFIETADPGGFLGTSFSSIVQISGGEAPGTHAFTAVVDVFDQLNAVSNNGNVDCQLLHEGPISDTVLDTGTLNVGEADAGHIAEGQITLIANAGIISGLLGSSVDLQCKAQVAAANVNADGTLRAIQVEDSTGL